jgi:DNA invertase Pin-like site-specific DNA recombinase
MLIDLEKIRLDGGTQPRKSIIEEAVRDYTERVLEGAKFTPVDLFFDGKDYWLADGFHRYHAHKRAGHKQIESTVHKGTKRDAFIFSRSANSKHGMPRTNEEKRDCVISLLEDIEYEGKSDREIAKICDVSNMTVGRIRKELELSKKKSLPPPPPAKPSLKPVATPPPPEPTEEDRVQELASELQAIAEENAKLKDKLAVRSMDELPEAQAEIEQTLEELRENIKQLEIELAAVTKSRNEYQNRAAEAIKQVQYWKRRAEKAERQAA